MIDGESEVGTVDRGRGKGVKDAWKKSKGTDIMI